MREDAKASWDPEGDAEYGRRMLSYVLRRYRYWLVAGVLIGGVLFGTVSVFLKPVYSTTGTLQLTKGIETPSALSNMPFFAQAATPALKDEMAIMSSREIGLAVIDELGLQVDTEDPNGPDALSTRLAHFFLPRATPGTRRARYTRLEIKDVRLDPDMLSKETLWISADGSGNWTAGGKSGRAGERVEMPGYSFLPVFGPAHRAGDRYNLTIKPAWRAWLDYRESLTVGQIGEEEPKANIVAVTYRHPNPVVAQRAVQLILDKYLKRNYETTYGDYDVLLQFISSEQAASDKLVRDLTEELQRYQEKTQLYQLSAQGGIAIQTIASLSQSKTSNRIQLNQIDYVLRMIETRTPQEIYETIQAPATPLGLESSLVAELSQRITELQVARQTKTDAHPEVKSLRTQIDGIIRQIRESLLSAKDGIILGEREIDKDIAKHKAMLATLPAATGKMGLLTADIQANQDILALLKQRETETKVQRASTSSEVRLLDEPPLPAKKDSPKLVRNGLMGCFAGALIAIILVLVVEPGRAGFRTLRELRLGLGLPVIAVIPGKPVRGPWRQPSEATLLARRLRRVLLREGTPLAIVHFSAGQACYDLAWHLGTGSAAVRSALFVDLDLLDATMSSALGHGAGKGFAEAAREQAPAADLVVKLAEGKALLRPGEGSFSAWQAEALLGTLAGAFDPVLLCLPAPSMWVNTDALKPLLKHAVLSVPQGAVSASALGDAVAHLRELGVGIAGVVVTGFSAGREPLAREELAHVSVAPAKLS